MTEEFRDRMHREWRMQRVREAVEAYRDAVDTAWYDFCREMRPPAEEETE